MSQQPNHVVNDIAARYFLVLGAAAADLWSELPHDLQHALFERAVVLGHRASPTRACASNWRNFCTTITRGRRRADAGKRHL